MEPLLRNRAIRTYLSTFPPSEHERVVKLTLLYGIQALHAHYTPEHLTTADLEQLLVSGAAALGVEETVPDMHAMISHLLEDLDNLKTNMSRVLVSCFFCVALLFLL